MIVTDEDGIASASKAYGEDMTAFPSDLIYQANAARRQELLVEAAMERRTAQLGLPGSRGTTAIRYARWRIGWFLLAVGSRLLGVGEATEQRSEFKP